jgi:DNA-binding MarR family transcriptional regulator
MNNMSERYLKQSRAMARLVMVANQLFRVISALVREHGLTESQFNALRILRGAKRRGESPTQAELADRLIASRANTTWILDKLEERKLVKRKDHRDRRKNLLEITSAGERLLAKIDPELESLFEGLLADVNDSDLAELERVTGLLRFE